MSAFDGIANDADLFVSTPSPQDVGPSEDTTNSSRFYAALIRVGDLVLNAGNKRPRAFIKILRQACLDDVCRETVLQLSGEEAQVVVDAIQLTLDELRLGDEFYRHALYLLVKLSANSNILPASLFVTGVDIGAVRDPIHGGGFADIFIGRYDGMDVAVKKLRFHGGDRALLHREFCREALVWRQLNHPNVLPFIGVDAETFYATNYLCMISPWMVNGTLANYVASDLYVPEKDCNRLLCEIASGLVYLHSQKVIHGDIHAANIFVSGEGHAQLADFGLAVVGDVTVGRLSSMGEAGGHLRYMAPERVNPASPDSRRTSAADVYSFACICIFLYTCHQPFPELLQEISVMFHIITGGRQQRPTGKQCRLTMQDAAWTIIERCWAQDPATRPSMKQVEQDLLRLDYGTDEPDLGRRHSRSSTHRLSHREFVRLSVVIPPLPGQDGSPPSPLSTLQRSPSVHSLSRATPTITTKLMLDLSDTDETVLGKRVQRAAPTLHVRTGARTDTSEPPSSPLDPRVAEILSALDSNPSVHVEDSVDVPRQPSLSVTKTFSHGRTASATLPGQSWLFHEPSLPMTRHRNSYHRRSTSVPLLPSTAADEWDISQDHRVFDFAGHPRNSYEQDGDDDAEVEDIMTEALRWSESPSAEDDLEAESQVFSEAAHSDPKTIMSPTRKNTNPLRRFWHFGMIKPSSRSRVKSDAKPVLVASSERTLIPSVQRLLHGPQLFRARAVRDRQAPRRAESDSTSTKLSFMRHDVLIVTRVEDGLWQAQKLDGEEGDVLPSYLEPEVLFRANKDDIYLVDVLGVQNVWWYVNTLGNVIHRVHSSRMFFDSAALRLDTSRTVFHSYTPEIQFQRHLVVEKYDEVMTLSDLVGDWTVARIFRRHYQISIPVSPDIGLIPTWLLIPSGQTENH